MNKPKSFWYDKRAEVNAAGMISLVIALAVAVIMISAMFPPALDTFYETNTTGWTIDDVEDTSTTSIWQMIPMLAVVAGLLIFVGAIVASMKKD